MDFQQGFWKGSMVTGNFHQWHPKMFVLRKMLIKAGLGWNNPRQP